MLTYQVRKRVFRTKDGEKPTFPAEVEVSLYLHPLQPFGKSLTGGVTAIKSGKVPELARLTFNANSGQFLVETELPLMPLGVNVQEGKRLFAIDGNCITIKDHVQDFETFENMVESFYYGLPMLLAVEFADPPIVERVSGKIGLLPFRWELLRWQSPFEVTPKEKQEQKVVTAWAHFSLISEPHRRRLIGALHYFHVACRLKRESKTPGEFLSEALLNFHKVLEILYGPDREKVRASLAQIGFSTAEIERDFIPSMLLRNSIDIGHPMLAIFTQHQLETLHMYADRAETVFRDLLNRLFREIEAGNFDIPAYEVNHVDKKTQETIEILRQRLNELN